MRYLRQGSLVFLNKYVAGAIDLSKVIKSYFTTGLINSSDIKHGEALLSDVIKNKYVQNVAKEDWLVEGEINSITIERQSHGHDYPNVVVYKAGDNLTTVPVTVTISPAFDIKIVIKTTDDVTVIIN